MHIVIVRQLQCPGTSTVITDFRNEFLDLLYWYDKGAGTKPCMHALTELALLLKDAKRGPKHVSSQSHTIRAWNIVVTRESDEDFKDSAPHARSTVSNHLIVTIIAICKTAIRIKL